MRGLTFELRRHQRCDARARMAKMYRVPLAGRWWYAVGTPLSSYVRPRMPTLAASSALFLTQRHAQRGTNVFVACGQLPTLHRELGQERVSFLHPQRFGACPAGRPREPSSAAVAARFRFVARPSSPPSSYISICCAAASHLRTVQGLTPRSSGAPTAAHQARSVVQEHSPQPGPGVLPLSPA